MIVPGIVVVPGKNAYPDRDGMKYAIAIHNTSNDGTAADEASFATRRDDNISSHFYADRTQVIQSLNTDYKAGHAGSDNGNQNAIAVEITGFNAWSRQKWLDNVDWNELGYVLAVVCAHYSIPVVHCTVAQMKANPKVKGFYGHDDMRLAWGGTTHTDPGPNFPWDRLLSAVSTALGNPTTGGTDMSFNDVAKADATFNNAPTATLDTDGTVDGSGNLRAFPNKTYDAIKALTAELEKSRADIRTLAAMIAESGSGDGLNAEQVRTIIREEIANVRLSIPSE